MAIPGVFIREDGKGFVVRKGGIDWEIYDKALQENGEPYFLAIGPKYHAYSFTIMQAVDNAIAKMTAREDALAKVRAAESPQGDTVIGPDPRD